MSKYIVPLIILMMLFSLLISADEVNISNTVPVNLTAGSSQSVILTITYTGTEPVTCTMSYLISPDDEGFNITYNPPTFALSQNTNQTVEMIINTSLMLVPLTYTITTLVTATTEYNQPIAPDDIHISTTPPDDTPPDDVPDETPDDTEPDDLQDDIIDTLPDETKTSLINYLPQILLILAIVGIITLLIYRRRRKNDKNK